VLLSKHKLKKKILHRSVTYITNNKEKTQTCSVTYTTVQRERHENNEKTFWFVELLPGGWK
jgi:hypothetical protein